VLLFYINAYVMVPLLVFRKKYFLYVVLLIVFLLAILLFHRWIYLQLIVEDRPFIWMRAVGFNLPPFVLTIAGSISFRFLRDQARSQKAHLDKQQENMKSELSFLRSQISPHFIFNVMNNMLALARLKSDQLEPTILKLSSLMRYMLYEADHEQVALRKEYDYLESYIDLQKQRMGDKEILSVEFKYSAQEYLIAPMLLIPFIENAFKHGMGNINKPSISILLRTIDNILYLEVLNKYNPQDVSIKDNSKGIGLVNVQRRLNLLYRDAHTLQMKNDGDMFSVILKINLNKYAPVYSSR
jgi:LytS/YehU family sensor histidine kinase